LMFLMFSTARRTTSASSSAWTCQVEPGMSVPESKRFIAEPPSFASVMRSEQTRQGVRGSLVVRKDTDVGQALDPGAAVATDHRARQGAGFLGDGFGQARRVGDDPDLRSFGRAADDAGQGGQEIRVQ